MISLIAAFGLVIGAMSFIYSTWVDFGLLLLLGFGNGYFAILLITWMQTRTPKEMLGRLMALVMLAGTGLAPISQAIAGVISKWDLTLLLEMPLPPRHPVPTCRVHFGRTSLPRTSWTHPVG